MDVLTGIRKGIESQSTAELLTQLLGIPWNPETGIRKGIERIPLRPRLERHSTVRLESGKELKVDIFYYYYRPAHVQSGIRKGIESWINTREAKQIYDPGIRKGIERDMRFFYAVMHLSPPQLESGKELKGSHIL